MDCRGFHWYQLFRHEFVAFGSRPGRALLWRPGALIGAFAMSGVLHDLEMWGLGRGTEFSNLWRILPSHGRWRLLGTWVQAGDLGGRRVGGLWGWVWTMAWTIGWGNLMLDAWSRRGMVAADFFPYGLRPGKAVVDALISLSRRESDIHLS